MNIGISLCLSCKTPSYNSKIERYNIRIRHFYQQENL